MITNNSKSHALTGTHNQRINKTIPSDHELTAAWTQQGHMMSNTNVSIPDNNAVEHAKDWVDDGSKL